MIFFPFLSKLVHTHSFAMCKFLYEFTNGLLAHFQTKFASQTILSPIKSLQIVNWTQVYKQNLQTILKQWPVKNLNIQPLITRPFLSNWAMNASIENPGFILECLNVRVDGVLAVGMGTPTVWSHLRQANPVVDTN